MAWWQQPFIQVALPIIIAFASATWLQGRAFDGINKRIDDLRDSVNKRLDLIEQRLGRIELLLADHDRRITMLEERTSILRP